MNERLPLDSIFMRTAILFAERSTCRRKKVGAVLVKDKRIISTGYVGSPSGHMHCIDFGLDCLIGPNGGCVRTIHAEINAVLFAAKNGISTHGTILYCTLSPCIDCAKMLISAGISKVFYYEEYRDKYPISILQNSGIDTINYINI